MHDQKHKHLVTFFHLQGVQTFYCLYWQSYLALMLDVYTHNTTDPQQAEYSIIVLVVVVLHYRVRYSIQELIDHLISTQQSSTTTTWLEKMHHCGYRNTLKVTVVCSTDLWCVLKRWCHGNAVPLPIFFLLRRLYTLVGPLVASLHIDNP